MTKYYTNDVELPVILWKLTDDKDCMVLGIRDNEWRKSICNLSHFVGSKDLTEEEAKKLFPDAFKEDK